MAPPLPVVAVVGAEVPLGRRVLERFDSSGSVERVVAIPSTSLLADDLAARLDGVDVVCHVAGSAAERDDVAAERILVEGMRRLLGAARGVGAMVLVSSATVYGAWPDNSIPLTEEAPIRPNPGCDFALHRAEIERMAREWSSANSGRTVGVLRAAVELDPDQPTWLAQSLQATHGVRPADADPPAQFVHLDDLADAVVVVARGRLDGVFNVAADGWLSADETRALTGTRHRVAVPETVATALARLTWRWRIGHTPPGFIPYVIHPWVVATDRLEAEGWHAAHANDEALVDSSDGSWFDGLSPGRRQTLLLAGTSAIVVAVLGGLVALVSRRRWRAARPA